MGENLNDNHWHTFNLRRHGNLVKMWVDDLAAKEGTFASTYAYIIFSSTNIFMDKCINFSIPNLPVIFINENHN